MEESQAGAIAGTEQVTKLWPPIHIPLETLCRALYGIFFRNRLRLGFLRSASAPVGMTAMGTAIVAIVQELFKPFVACQT